MLISKEKRAFWLFLLWVLILPVICQPGLLAQDDDMFIVDDSAPVDDAPAAENAGDGSVASGDVADAPLPDEGGSVNEAEIAVTDQAGEDAVVGDNAGVEEAADPADDEENLNPELPALSADPQQLLAEVNGPAKAGKHKAVVAKLSEHEDAVSELPELLAIYVEALLNQDKVDWNTVNRFARQLTSRDPSSSVGYYAQGMYYQNSKRSDLGKSITLLGKAKSAKKPYPAAATAYYMAIAKKYGVIALALVLLPIVAVVKKIKAKKAAKLNLDDLPDQTKEGEEGEAGAEKSEEKSSEENAKDSAAAEKKPSPKKKSKSKAKTSKEKPVAEKEEKTENEADSEDEEGEDVEKAIARAAVTKAEPAAAEPVAAPVADVTPPAAVPSAAPVAPAPALSAPPSSVSYQTITAKHEAEIEHLRELLKPGRRPPVQADPQLDALWSELSRKAISGKIAPQFRREESAGSGFRSAGSRSPASSAGYPEPMAPEVDFNVSMDLSEEALKDDLTVKLKMMAISDGELREMFAQKNPRHVPHLIEYVLTKPEPVRLAFVARELGNYEDPAVIDVLAGLLYHDDQRVSLAAIQGLEATKKVSAIQYLCPFLRSEIPVLAQAARTALNNFGAVKIMQAFHNLPENSDARIRSAGVFVLSRMKGPQVEELLKKMLNDDSLDIRCDVILAMSYQKNPVYLDDLREFFRIASDRDKVLARKAIVYLQGFVSRKKLA